MPLLVDTGILYALADADDAWHERSRDLVASTRETLLVPSTVLPEVCYLLHERLGAGVEKRFLRSVAEGELVLEAVGLRDLARVLEILDRHEEIGFVDASVVATAERLRLRAIATTERRHFARVRPKHVSAFELVP